MPVAGLRGRDSRVEYVVVRESTVQRTPVEHVPRRFEPIDSFNDIPGVQNERRDDSDDEDDWNDKLPTQTDPAAILITMTLPQEQATGTALADNDPTETVVVEFTPGPKPPHKDANGGISQTTEHLLIAAGSIGATIIVVMVLLAIHTMRKRGLTLAEAIKYGKHQVTRRGPPPPPKVAHDKASTYSSDYGSMRKNSIPAPEPVAARSGSISSQRPLMAPQRNQSPRTASPDNVPQSFLLDSPPRRNNSHRRDVSDTPSSPVLPLQTQRRSVSTHNTQSLTGESDLAFPQPPADRSLSPLPPPPTFKQFLNGRPSISSRPANGGAMISRFSWTNSNAPQTPHDPSRDTNSHTIGRDSYMTTRSSVPRFRTVDSWVQQQSNRIEEQKLKEQFRFTPTSSSYFHDDDRERSIPEVPELPKNVTSLRESALKPSQALNSNPVTPPPPANGLPGKNVRHERHDTQVTVETAPIFRQHPGTEVRFSTRSLVPSEILNNNVRPNVLS